MKRLALLLITTTTLLVTTMPTYTNMPFLLFDNTNKLLQITAIGAGVMAACSGALKAGEIICRYCWGDKIKESESLLTSAFLVLCGSIAAYTAHTQPSFAAIDKIITLNHAFIAKHLSSTEAWINTILFGTTPLMCLPLSYSFIVAGGLTGIQMTLEKTQNDYQPARTRLLNFLHGPALLLLGCFGLMAARIGTLKVAA